MPMNKRTITEHLRARLLKCLEPPPQPISWEEMRVSQWDKTFIQYMQNRMVFGGYRYGLIHSTTAPQYDNIGSIIERAQKYRNDGNQEWLVDIANLAMIEFVRGCCHPAPHFSAQDDGYHTQELAE